METLHSSLQPIWLERVKSELLRPKLALETEGTEWPLGVMCRALSKAVWTWDLASGTAPPPSSQLTLSHPLCFPLCSIFSPFPTLGSLSFLHSSISPAPLSAAKFQPTFKGISREVWGVREQFWVLFHPEYVLLLPEPWVEGRRALPQGGRFQSWLCYSLASWLSHWGALLPHVWNHKRSRIAKAILRTKLAASWSLISNYITKL